MMPSNLRSVVFLTIIGSFLSSTEANGQNAKSKGNANLASLSEGVDLGREQLKVLSDDPHTASFLLKTSWIPGEGHKGYIRFRILVTGDGVALKEAPAFIERIHACTYSLELQDKGGFILRRIPLTFINVVADNGDITRMLANDISQLDSADYKSFLLGENWNISWSCK